MPVPLPSFTVVITSRPALFDEVVEPFYRNLVLSSVTIFTPANLLPLALKFGTLCGRKALLTAESFLSSIRLGFGIDSALKTETIGFVMGQAGLRNS